MLHGTTPGKNYVLSSLRGFFFCLAVNKLITDKMQNIFSLITELSGNIKYSINKLDEVTNINDMISLKPHRGKYYGINQC